MPKRKKAVSLQTIADQVGVSKYAVSLALNGKAGVSASLREQIIRVAKESGYVRSPKTTPAKKLNILVLIPQYIQNDTAFYPNVYWAIEQSIQEQGHSAIFTSVSDEMSHFGQLPSALQEAKIAGMIVVGQVPVSYMRKLLDTGLPCVSVDEHYRTVDVDCILTANTHGADQMVQHLIDCGHTDIGFIGAIHTTSSNFDRWVGYQNALARNGIAVNRSHCITADSPKESLLSRFDELSRHLDGLPSLPTAWFCANDGTAVTLISLLRLRGIRVPEDISVVGFDDQSMAAMISPSLTTYHVPRKELGRAAVHLLLFRIASPACACREISVRGYPVYRDSVKNQKE